MAKEFDNIFMHHITVRAKPSTLVEECIDEAIVLALAEDATVVLEHNSGQFQINPVDIRNAVILPKEA